MPIIRFFVEQRLFSALLVLAVGAVGVWAWQTLPIDAFPDATNIQVMVLTRAPGLSTTEVERRISYPVERAMVGLPRVREVRSLSKNALSQVNVIFEETTGKDLGEHVMAFFDDDAPKEGEPVLAANAPPRAATANIDFAPAMAAWADQVLMPAPVQVQAMSPPPTARPQMADMLSYSALPQRPAQPAPPPSAMASVQAIRPAAAPRIDPAVSRHSVAAVTSALREAEQEADLFAIMDFQPSMWSGETGETGHGPDNPPGALAPAGGWFSDAMLEALEKYEKTARLSDTPQPAASVDDS